MENRKLLKKDCKKQTGITLIALVITIIVLLILAGISIAMIVTNNSIIFQAKEAKEKTYNASADEILNLIEQDWIIAKKENPKADLNQFLQPYLTNKQIDSMNDMKDSIEIVKSGKIKTIKKDIINIIKIGEGIKYSPGDESGYIIESKYSGVSSEQVIKTENFDWQVYKINENQTIDIISTLSSNTKVALKGALGYNNGITLLNKLCDNLYSNKEKNINAKSISLEDILYYIDENKIAKKTFFYNTSIKYTDSEYLKYPIGWAKMASEKNSIDGIKINGNITRSQNTELIANTIESASKSLELTYTRLSSDLLQDPNNNTIGSILIKQNLDYWIATKQESCGANFLNWGLYSVNSNSYRSLYTESLFRNGYNSGEYERENCYRVICNVPINQVTYKDNSWTIN